MNKVSIEIDGDDYWIEGGDFEDLLDTVKRIPGRQYLASERRWLLSGAPRDIARAIRPFRLMFVDADLVSDSVPTQIYP